VISHAQNSQVDSQIFNHIFTHDATFKSLKDERKDKVIADIIWDNLFLGSKAKVALFSKAHTDLCATHFDANFLLEEIDKSGAKMNFTGLELLRRVEKRQ
jgi:hypothetical protein